MTKTRMFGGELYEEVFDAEIGDIAVYENGRVELIAEEGPSGRLRGVDGWRIFGVKYPSEIYRKVQEWFTGDIVRCKGTGKEVEVYRHKPERRTFGLEYHMTHRYLCHSEGFTYIEDSVEVWRYISGYELVSRNKKEEEVNMKKAEELLGLIKTFEEVVESLIEDGVEQAEDKGELRVGDLVKVKEEFQKDYSITDGDMVLGVVSEVGLVVEVRILFHKNPENNGDKYRLTETHLETVEFSEGLFGLDTSEKYKATAEGEFGDIREGELVEVVEACYEYLEDGDSHFIEVKNERGHHDFFQFGELELVTAQRFNVGDYVTIKDEFGSSYNITDKDMLLGQVTQVDPDFRIKVISHKNRVFESERAYRVVEHKYELTEPSEASFNLDTEKRYKVLGEVEFGRIEKGVEVAIIGIHVERHLVGGGGDLYFIEVRSLTTDRKDYVKYEDLKELDELVEEPAEESLGVGDIVYYEDRVWFENSGLGEIIDVQQDGKSYRVRAVDGDGDLDMWWLNTSKITLVVSASDRKDKDL